MYHFHRLPKQIRHLIFWKLDVYDDGMFFKNMMALFYNMRVISFYFIFSFYIIRRCLSSVSTRHALLLGKECGKNSLVMPALISDVFACWPADRRAPDQCDGVFLRDSLVGYREITRKHMNRCSLIAGRYVEEEEEEEEVRPWRAAAAAYSAWLQEWAGTWRRIGGRGERRLGHRRGI